MWTRVLGTAALTLALGGCASWRAGQIPDASGPLNQTQAVIPREELVGSEELSEEGEQADEIALGSAAPMRSTDQILDGVVGGIGFVGDTSRLDREARRQLRELAERIGQDPDLRIEVVSYAPYLSRALAERRAFAVSRALAAAGVDLERVERQVWFGLPPRLGGDERAAEHSGPAWLELRVAPAEVADER